MSTQLDLLPVPPSYSRGTAAGASRLSDTSQAAAASIQSDLAARQARVLNVIRDRAGATCFEVASDIGTALHRVSGRIRELVLRDLVYDSGERRTAPSGRTVTVWKVKP
jgi:hypothetical protein